MSTDQVTLLFSEAMQKLSEIKTEMMELRKETIEQNIKLNLTIERQLVATQNYNKMESKLAELAASQQTCPARKAQESKTTLLKDMGVYLALVLSGYAVFKIFIGG